MCCLAPLKGADSAERLIPTLARIGKDGRWCLPNPRCSTPAAPSVYRVTEAARHGQHSKSRVCSFAPLPAVLGGDSITHTRHTHIHTHVHTAAHTRTTILAARCATPAVGVKRLIPVVALLARVHGSAAQVRGVSVGCGTTGALGSVDSLR